MEIIGLLGHQGVGKNYIAENILTKYLEYKPTLIIAFADHFKIDGITKYNLNYEKVFGQKDYETRKKLHTIGTDEGRDKYGEDIWIKTTFNWMKVLHSRGIERFIIPDLRYQNEVDWVKSVNGVVIKIEAPNRYMTKVVQEAGKDVNKIKNLILHSSEKSVDNIENYDICINNDLNDNINKEIIKFLAFFNKLKNI